MIISAPHEMRFLLLKYWVPSHAVAVARPLQSEGAECLGPSLVDFLPADVRSQVLYVASDNPSYSQAQALLTAFPNMKALYLDPVHLPIVYQTAFWGKSSNGQRYVRKLQAKFNKVDYNTTADHWGNIFSGDTVHHLTDAEEDMRLLIMSGGMSVHKAAALLNDIDVEKPWYRKLEYIQGAAAVSALFPEEMERKTYMQGRPMRSVLMSATAPDRLAWYWNSLIVRRRLPKEMQGLLGAGTTPNESLHNEINNWYRNQPEVFPTTLALQLDVGSLFKLLTHNSAMYSPTLRQYGHSEVKMVMAAQLDIIDVDKWATWCGEQRCVERGVVRKAPLPMLSQRQALKKAIKDTGVRMLRIKRKIVLKLRPASVLKRPASALKRPAAQLQVELQVTDTPAQRPLKRTPFTRKKGLGCRCTVLV